ncbi:arabinan endo-1,5-alpha-L-arabinosidase [Phocaeicola plebeius]|uniref:arabinan endo-1,5-alpha-L-arabinosidase n=1 Tax=Phocaeicola plebeius TaxID=310297 RepID=UPI0026EC30AE|nr:arabinan endo-1,5-alpha-L-arabinosidase [Phocaeicola plebeius]
MNIKNALKYVFVGLACVLSACSDEENGVSIGNMSLEKPSVSNVTYKSVDVSAQVKDPSSYILKRGICYGTEASPTIENQIVEVEGSGSDINVVLSGLTESTTYYVRAFVTVLDNEPMYSEEVQVTTLAATLDDKLADYVAPDYEDDYTSIAGWDKRNEWNLANVHDPSVVLADDGYYYMYQTDASYGDAHDGHGHFHCRRSKDLVNWEYMGATMQEAPAWVKENLNAYRAEMGLEPIESPSYGYWAPVVRKVKTGLYRMYYSIVVNHYIKTGKPQLVTDENFDGSWTERAFIGLMETSDPASNVWEDKGMVVCSSSDRGMNDWSRPNLNNWDAYFYFNAIDPTYLVDKDGTHWLIYGSWHSGIAEVELNPETGLPKTSLGKPWGISNWNTNTYGKLIARRRISRWQGSEGPEVVYNLETGYYYMFLAYGSLAVEYNTRVVRAQSMNGPWLDINGNDAANGIEAQPVVTHPYKFSNSYGWVGISHCAVFDDGNGNWFYSSQGRLPENVPGVNESNAVMMGHVRSIRWTEDGWPLVMPERYGAVPQVPITEGELIGDWEMIQMSSNHPGQQYASAIMTLSADHKIAEGTWKGGTWSYDAENQVLTANGVKLYLQREVDWEMIPRTPTIVFAGYHQSNGVWRTDWGKKVQ